jgi:hypothetical protein
MDVRSALLRSRLAEQPALLVLDNARDAEQVRPLLPGSAALVIVTSRDQLRGLSIQDGAFRVTLRPLTQWESVELLTGGATAEPATALAELCDRLPLALAIAADRVRRAGSLAQVFAELTNEQTRLEFLDSWGNSPATSLRAAMSWSCRALEPAAAAMLRSLGRHPAKEIEVDTAATLANVSVTQAQVLLDQLAGAHLAVECRPNRYLLPGLIRLYANELL